MTRFVRLTALLLGLIFSLSGIPAYAQSNTNNQLMYELLNRIERLEQEIRQLRGDQEVYRYRYDELSHRLQALEGGHPAPDRPQARIKPIPDSIPIIGLEPASPIITEPNVLSRPKQPPQPLSDAEQTAYDNAFAHLREGQYPQAIIKFEDFLRDYPNNTLTSNAYYWLGQAYYVNRDFKNARDAFLVLGSRYPDSDKLSDTLLKLGYSYEELGDRNKARQVYEKLKQNYPNSRAATLAGPRLQLLR